MFAVPVILESESQKRSTAFLPIVDRRLWMLATSMLEWLIASSPAWPPRAMIAPSTVACELFMATIPCPMLPDKLRYPLAAYMVAPWSRKTPDVVPPEE